MHDIVRDSRSTFRVNVHIFSDKIFLSKNTHDEKISSMFFPFNLVFTETQGIRF